MSTSPTTLSLKALRDAGYTVAIVEHWKHQVKARISDTISEPGSASTLPALVEPDWRPNMAQRTFKTYRPTVSERLQRRLIASSTKSHNATPCMEWQGARLPKGYGKIGDRRQKGTGWALTHRIAYEAAFGPIPDGQLVCHHCDNPPCCNPDHLFLGTHVDNAADMWAKGRQNMWWAP